MKPPLAAGVPEGGSRVAEPQYADATFPVSGLDVSVPLERQTPHTTPLGVNVRTFEPTTLRGRGGSRCGLSQYIPQQVVAAGLVLP